MLVKRLVVVVAGATLLVATACSSNSNTTSTYKPQGRTFNMVTVPLIIGEFGDVPTLHDEIGTALKAGGPLQGHEVYGWEPSSITVYEGDTVTLLISNAQKDDHIFNLPDLGITNATVAAFASGVKVTFVASKLGAFQYFCSVPTHMPWMQGFLTVLPDSDAG